MPDLDQIALDTVEAIAKIDPDKLKGGRAQALAQAQCLVRDALQELEEVGAENYTLTQEVDAALEQVIYWRERAVGAEAERDGWIESARHFANGQEFYQGIVRQIGGLLGEAAYTSDDGSVQDDVLALKVPELVEALAAHVERLAGLWNAFCMCHEDEHGAYGARLNAAFGEAPAASLAHLKAQWQAKGAQLTADSIRYEYEGEIHHDRIADHADEVAAELRQAAEEDPQ